MQNYAIIYAEVFKYMHTYVFICNEISHMQKYATRYLKYVKIWTQYAQM